MKNYLFLTIASFFALLGIFFYQESVNNDKNLHLVVCDVGQGDSIYIKTPSGKDILVDAGPSDKVLDCLGSNMPFWDRDIELVILTHPDADHLTGLVSVLERYNVLNFVTSKTSKDTGIYKKFLKALKNEGLSLKYVFANDKIDFSDGSFSNVIWPSSEATQKLNPKNYSVVNEYSIIQVLQYGNFRALLTGDAGKVVEDQIAAIAGDVDLLKVPHHGSKTGMSDYFLSQVLPEISIISVGKGNRYGHPTKEALDLLSKYKTEILRTDKEGEIEIITNGKTFWRVD
ncbi:MAG: MBL fold metallo-hydrolase [Candidatus Levybacteria bacterium]|nr:MBL fold metallo-hydrolase [Candidatus Levybacteria bacterium]